VGHAPLTRCSRPPTKGPPGSPELAGALAAARRAKVWLARRTGACTGATALLVSSADYSVERAVLALAPFSARRVAHGGAVGGAGNRIAGVPAILLRPASASRSRRALFIQARQ
jgi:hypothetical protein